MRFPFEWICRLFHYRYYLILEHTVKYCRICNVEIYEKPKKS